MRYLSLKAAQKELLAARQEPGVDPAIADELLNGVDRILIAATQDMKLLK